MRGLRETGRPATPEGSARPHRIPAGRVWAAGVLAALWVTAAFPALSARALEVRLANGQRFSLEAAAYDGEVLVAELSYGQLRFPRKDLRYLTWEASLPDAPDLDRFLVLKDGTRIRGSLQRLSEGRAVVAVGYGTLTVSDLSVISSVGFATLESSPYPPGGVFEAVLEDASRLVGEPTGFDGKTLGFRTRYGELRISAAAVVLLRRPGSEGGGEPGVLALRNGDQLRAVLQGIEGGRWLFTLPFGRLVIEEPAAVAILTFPGVASSS